MRGFAGVLPGLWQHGDHEEEIEQNHTQFERPQIFIAQQGQALQEDCQLEARAAEDGSAAG